jgi:hypothetical protein
MRNTLWCWLALSIVCCAFPLNPATANSRFETGFRGIAWGTHKDQLPDLGLSKKAVKNIYATGPSSVFLMEGKGNLAMEIDGIALLSIFLNFHDQVFHGVDMVFNPRDKDLVRAVIVNEMGTEGDRVATGRYWHSGCLTILLTDRELMVSYETVGCH